MYIFIFQFSHAANALVAQWFSLRISFTFFYALPMLDSGGKAESGLRRIVAGIVFLK